MSGENQALIQELAARMAQADAVVIGGGSGLSSAAGYDHYHWSPALSGPSGGPGGNAGSPSADTERRIQQCMISTPSRKKSVRQMPF